MPISTNSSATSASAQGYLLQYFFWPLFFISHLLLVSLLAWHLLAQANFAYPLGYKLLDINAQIQEFAPRNHFKHDFEHTTPQQHLNIFAEISEAIQNSGKGLTEITYPLPNGTETAFMHNAEIIHLQDVANLVELLYQVGIIASIGWAILLFIAYRYKLLIPRLRIILLSYCAAIVAITIAVLSIGATHVFYWFHTKIFPEGHQWFFYYEDSLMTTLMKAPDIFGFIAVLLVSLIVIIWIISIWATHKLLSSHHLNNNQLKAANKIQSAPPHKPSTRNKRKK